MPSPNNFVGEWFGHRIYPDVKVRSGDIASLLAKECPFLTKATGHDTKCVKNANSSGVCTITTTSKIIKDWMVCPYRSLDSAYITQVVKRLFQISGNVFLFPVTTLSENIDKIKESFYSGTTPIAFFQDKLGGEINLSATDKSPELSFDITFVPLKMDRDTIQFDKFGIYEVQTMDFHGSYKHAVNALRNALDLHGSSFPQTLNANPEWMGRKIEGPNIANVFKRTFYQLMIKFKLAGHGACAGVILGLPNSVWESWSPHLNGPQLKSFDDYMVFDGTTPSELANSWIYIFEADRSSSESREPLKINQLIRVDVEAMLNKAFTEVPEYITGSLVNNIHASILKRIRAQYSSVEIGV